MFPANMVFAGNIVFYADAFPAKADLAVFLTVI
jgi:hypothetical protein